MPEEAANMGEQPVSSFRERKTAQLREERGAGDVPGESTALDVDPDDHSGAPLQDAESVDEQLDDPALFADDELEEEQEGSDEDLDDEAPESEDLEAAEGEESTWEKRYKDLQSETQSILESRGEMEHEHAQGMSQVLDLQFQVEDRYNEALMAAELTFNTLSGNASQYKNIDWSRVHPDQIGEIQQQSQQALLLEQQARSALDAMKQQAADAKEQTMKRQSAIAQTRLRRTIPDWGKEKYSEIRQFAVDNGMAAQRFNEFTDPQVIEWAHTAMTLSRAGSVQKVKTKRKTATPRGKAARKQARDNRGQFARKQVQPNTPGSFASKHQHRLAMERQGR